MSRKRSEAPSTSNGVPTKRCRNVVSNDQIDEGDAAEDAEADYPGDVSQKIIAEITKLLQNHVRSGKIQKMILKNFMCHSNLLVDFNKRVNLLVGNNGSGKSAVLTALIVGLGSGALATNRSNSIKHLIKNGENSSNIEIHISNDGFDAYDQSVFGKKIIVTRTLMASGSSTYKLKDEKGHVVSSSKADLMRMTLCLNIQAENPVCVLNQDQARSFLKESDPAKRYKLFLKATQIDVIIEKLNDCAHHYTSAKNQLEFQRRNIDHMKKELAQTQDKYSKLQSVETLKVELQSRKNDLNWSFVKVCEDEMDELKKELSSTAKLLTELMDEVKSREGTKEKLTEKMTEIAAEIAAMRTTVGAEAENYEKIRQEMVKITEEKANQVRNVKKTEVKLQRTLTDIQHIEGTLAERNDSNANNNLRQKKENEQKIQEFNEKCAEIEAMVDNVQRDVDMYNNTINQEQDVLESTSTRKNNIIGKMRQLKSQISQIDSKAADSLAVYGRDMPKLAARIKQLTDQGKFSKLPRGPLGHYIQVPDRKWRAVVEQTIGNHVRTFCVNVDSDRVVLDELFRKEFPQLPKGTIITGKFADRVYDVSNGRVQAVQNTQTMMSVLKVSDVVVMNCLIDQVRIESILLVEDQALATHLTSDEENIPHNLMKVILLKPLSEIFPAPAYRSYALAERQVRFIQVNTAEQKRQYSQELQENGQKMGAIEAEFKESNAKIANLKRSLVQRQQQLKSMEAEKRQLTYKISELKAIEYPAEQDSEMLLAELEEFKKSIEEIEAAVAAEKAKLEALEEKEQEKDAKLKMSKVKKRQIDGEIQKLQDNHDAQRAQMSNLDNNKQYNQNLLKSYSDELATKKADFEKKKKNHVVISQQAAQFGTRTESEHSTTELNAIIKTMEKRIRTICSSKEKVSDVKDVLDMQQEKLNLSMSVIDVLSKTLKTLSAARHQRFTYISRLKDHMSLRVKQKFHILMNLRGYIGEVKIDHKDKHLELSIVPRDKNVQNAVSNTKSLSGGERSYSTVAFLISLWSCVDHPFYFLDEYDVFTDQINRHCMTMLLLREAEMKPDRQYTFLTPQDMSAIDASEMITIHRMQDPERC